MSKAYKYICPCKDCDKRHTTCHKDCKEYKDWKDSGVEIPTHYIYYRKIVKNLKKLKKY